MKDPKRTSCKTEKGKEPFHESYEDFLANERLQHKAIHEKWLNESNENRK